MEMTGEQFIAAPRAKVFAALNDPEILKAVVPGCTAFEKGEDGDFTATVRVRIGPLSTRFRGAVTLSDVDPPRAYRISAQGRGAAAGLARGDAEVTLTEVGGGTVLSYTARADVGGKLAGLAGHLIDGTARKLSGRFFGKFAALIAPPADRAPETDADAPRAVRGT